MAYGGWRGLHLEQLLIHVVRRAQPPGVQSQAPTVQRVHLLLSDWLPDGVQNCQQADEIRRKERKEKGGRDGRREKVRDRDREKGEREKEEKTE